MGLCPKAAFTLLIGGVLACLQKQLIPGHRALLRDEANMSGAGGEMIRAVSIWACFFNAPRRKQQLPLNIGKKTNTKNCNFGRHLLRI